jgi:predicted amidohydrolase YtcJ
VLGDEGLRVSAAEALRACTLDAAWACHRAAEVGSIEAGKLADLAILSADPTAVDVGSISSIRVEETWSGGEPVV